MRLLSLTALCGLALALSSCANENVAKDDAGADADNNNKNLTAFIAGAPESRTSMDYNTGAFFWEAGDYIYVQDDNNVWRKSSNAPTAKTASYKFYVPGKFEAKSSYRVYYPGKNGSNNQVTIPAAQAQTEPNSTAHFGVSGDCASALATKVVGISGFSFTLDHQPAILVFQPYTSNTILKDCYLTKVEVTSDDNITGTYTLNPTTGQLMGSGNGKQITLAANAPISGHPGEKGFLLTNTTANPAVNGAYMVIKPGTYKLKVRYWVKDLVTDVEGTITKLLSSFNYKANTYYDMTAALDVTNYTTPYYMWDAQQPYWYGHEWDKAGYVAGVDQPTVHNASGSAYPQAGDPLNRWYNTSFPGYNIQNDAQTALFKTLPNANEMCWYISPASNPRWDEDELWTSMGHLYKGGVWLKKKSAISGFSSTISPDGVDRRTVISSSYQRTLTNISTNPISAADAGNYFYLPVLGYLQQGKLSSIGSIGHYWTLSGSPWAAYMAYSMGFTDNIINVDEYNRFEGASIGAFE